MDKKRMKIIVALLFATSILIYALQIIIFKDRKTTAFYIFQDLAFMPISVAITTVIIGDLINRNEQREKRQKTRMLTSSFFTQMGTELTDIMLEGSANSAQLREIMNTDINSKADLKALYETVKNADLQFTLTKEVYDGTIEMIRSRRLELITISSNPLLFENESFTKMLWGMFHLIDEYKLRGEYDELDEQGKEHMTEDFEKVLKLLIFNRTLNLRYLKETYPDFYAVSVSAEKSKK